MKYIEFLKSLEESELKDFKSFVVKRLNSKSDLLKLFNLTLSKYNDEFLFDKIENIKLKYFKKSPIKSIQNNFSILYNLAEDWITINQLNNEKNLKDILIYKWMNKKATYHLSNIKHKELIDELDTDENYSDLSDYSKFQIWFHLLYFNNPIVNELGSDPYKKMCHHFFSYVSISSLIIKAEIMNYGLASNDILSNELAILDSLLIQDKSKEINLLKEVLSLITNPNKISYVKISKILFNQQIEKESMLEYVVFSYLRKFCIRLINRRELDPIEIIKCLDFGIKSGVLTHNGGLSIVTYHNLVMSVSNLLPSETVVKYIKEWSKLINQKNKDATIKLAMAQKHFYQEKYDLVIPILRRNEYKLDDQKRLAYVLELMSSFIFRKSNPQEFKNSMASFYSFLKRNQNKLQVYVYESYNNLYRFISELSTDKFKYSDTKHIKRLSNRSWCEKQILLNSHTTPPATFNAT